MRERAPTRGRAITGGEIPRSGENYTGSYLLSQFAGSPDEGTEFNDKGTPLAVFKATITAHRVTVK